MATGPEHYQEAEEIIATAKNKDLSPDAVVAIAAVAQVHATLASTAAHALRMGSMPNPDWKAWYHAAATDAHPVVTG